MGYQTTVNSVMGFGVPGELLKNSPVISAPWTLVSDPVENTIGYAFTVTSQGIAACGGTGVFAGILADPKVYAGLGTSTNTLGASLVLPDESIGELVTMGTMVVAMGGAANIGDTVIYAEATGALTAVSPSATIGSGYQKAYATVVDLTLAGAGLAVIEIMKTPTNNAHA